MLLLKNQNEILQAKIGPVWNVFVCGFPQKFQMQCLNARASQWDVCCKSLSGLDATPDSPAMFVSSLASMNLYLPKANLECRYCQTWIQNLLPVSFTWNLLFLQTFLIINVLTGIITGYGCQESVNAIKTNWWKNWESYLTALIQLG